MADDKTFGGLAKKWLRAQVKELTASDRHERASADVQGERAERDMREKATEEAVLSAVPGLRDWKERQEAQQAANEAEREQRRIDELHARPLAGVGISVSGGPEGSWAGQLPAKVETRPDTEYDEATGEEHEVGRTLVIDLEARDDAVPLLAGQPLVGWRLVVPDYDGPGTYDLAAIVRRREESGGYVEYTDWCLGLGGWDEPLYWGPDTGPATVEVAEDERSIVVRMAVEGAGGGPYDVVAQLNLP